MNARNLNVVLLVVVVLCPVGHVEMLCGKKWYRIESNSRRWTNWEFDMKDNSEDEHPATVLIVGLAFGAVPGIWNIGSPDEMRLPGIWSIGSPDEM